MEAFRKLEEYPGLEIGQLGTIIGIRGHALVPGLCSGHLHITYKDKNVNVHKLVGLAWVKGWFEGAIINHLDGNKANPRWDNLEWTTHAGNTAHALKYGLRKTVAVVQLTKEGEIIKEWGSITEAAQSLGIRGNNIVAAAKGRQPYGQGFKWEYA